MDSAQQVTNRIIEIILEQRLKLSNYEIYDILVHRLKSSDVDTRLSAEILLRQLDQHRGDYNEQV